MTEFITTALDNMINDPRESRRLAVLQEETYRQLAARYDDALKRINDLESELEYLRWEVNRG